LRKGTWSRIRRGSFGGRCNDRTKCLISGKLFQEAVPLTGIALTKLDGTAKGGIVLALANELKIPVKLVGVGEQYEDLQDFDPKLFATTLFGEGEYEE